MKARSLCLAGLAVSLLLPGCEIQPPATAGVTHTSGKRTFYVGYQLDTYQSKVLGYERNYGVSLPPDYNLHPDRRYPVIFLLHGGHGDPSDVFQREKGDILTVLPKLYATGKLPLSIIITPDGYPWGGISPHHDPPFIDGPQGKIDTAIGDELVKVVQSRYRTLPAPDFWAIGGLSSGAWGAANIGLHHPDHFSVLVCHSGYYEDVSGPKNSPQTYITTMPPDVLKRLHIYVDVGTKDELLDGSQQFHQLLDRLGVDNEFHSFGGGHIWGLWHRHFRNSLGFVGKYFQQAASRDHLTLVTNQEGES